MITLYLIAWIHVAMVLVPDSMPNPSESWRSEPHSVRYERKQTPQWRTTTSSTEAVHFFEDLSLYSCKILEREDDCVVSAEYGEDFIFANGEEHPRVVIKKWP